VGGLDIVEERANDGKLVPAMKAAISAPS